MTPARTRWVRPGGIALAAGLAIMTAWTLLGGAPPVAGSLARAERGDLAIDVAAAGVLAAARSVDVTAPISSNPHFFKIARLTPEGARVQPGDTLMELDAQDVTRQLEDDEAEAGKTADARAKRELEYDLLLRDLRVRIEEARVLLEAAALKREIEPHLISSQERRAFQLELEQATQAHSLLGAKLAATEQMMASELAVLGRTLANIDLRVRQARDLQASLVVKAPIAGTLLYKVMADGAKRRVGEQTCHHEVILQIPDLSTLRVDATVNEQDAGQVRVGQPVRIRLDALPDIPVTGRVAAVGTALQTKRDNPIKVVDIRIEIDPVDAQLSPGMTAAARIEVSRVAQTLLVPVSFLYERDGVVFARVVGRGGRPEERAIRPGRRNGTRVEVLDGLVEGDMLVTPS